jgi:AcrR family transcriptional regulator
VARISSADRRQAIILAALRVIQREGVHGATTRAIVAEADMSLASFHYVFRSRDEMLSELIAYIVENEGRAAFATLSADRDIRSALRAGLQAYFDTLTADPSWEQATFELVHYALRTEELSELPRLQYRMYRRTVGELLIAGADMAGIRWRLPLDQVARLLVTFITGLTIAWLADRDNAAAALTMDFAAESLAALAEPLDPAESTDTVATPSALHSHTLSNH